MENRMNYARVKHYKATHSDGSHVLEPFNEAQAKDYGTILETDGIALDAAIRMVDNWNTQAIRQGNSVRYSIHDFSNCESFAPSDPDVEFSAAIDGAASRTSKLLRIAIVAANAGVTEMVGRYIETGLSPYAVKFFDSLQEARTWAN